MEEDDYLRLINRYIIKILTRVRLTTKWFKRLFGRIKLFIIKWLFLIPIIQLGCSFVLLWIDYNYYLDTFTGAAHGWSVLTSIGYINMFVWSNRGYCMFTKVASWALLITSAYNCLGVLITYVWGYGVYEESVEKVVTTVCVLLVITYIVQKELED